MVDFLLPESEKVPFQKIKNQCRACIWGQCQMSDVWRTMERIQLWTRLPWWESGVLWPSEKSLLIIFSRFCIRSAEMFRIADVEDHQVLSSGALCTGWFTSGTWKVQRKASRRTPRRTKSSRRRWYLKLADKYFSRKIRKTFVKSIKNISSLCFFFRWRCCPTWSGATQTTFTWISAVTRWPFYPVVPSTSKSAQFFSQNIFIYFSTHVRIWNGKSNMLLGNI